MDFKYWTSVIKDWANALCLVENEIKEIKEMESTGFFTKLIGYLQSDNISNMFKSSSDSENIANFIKGRYPHYDLRNENEWDDKEVVNIATLLLINTSLYSLNNEMKNRSCSLPNTTQSALCSVLELFVDCQPHLITREMIVDAINQGSNPSSPSKSLNSSAYYSSSPKSHCESPFSRQTKELQRKEREMKRLKIKLDLISSEKSDLESELMLAKDSIDNLKEEVKKKETDIKKLQGEVDSEDHSLEITKQQSSVEERFKELDCKYKDAIDTYEVKISTLLEEIKKLQNDKRELNYKLTSSEKNVLATSQKVCLLQEENLDLTNKISSLEKYIGELVITCKEQADIISETKNEHCVSSMTNDSDVSTTNCESLAYQVIDLQLKEMEDKFKSKCIEVKDMSQTIETLNKDVVCLQAEINNHISTAESAKAVCTEILTQVQELCHIPECITSSRDDLVDMINCLKTSLISKCATELTKKNQLISELEDTIQSLKCKLIIKDDAITNLETENENDKLTIKKLKSSLKEANIMSTVRNSDKIKLQHSVKTLTSTKDKLELQISALTESLNSKTAHVEIIETEVANLNESVNKLQLENSELKKEILVCQSEAENLSMQLGIKIKETELLRKEGPNNEQAKKEYNQKMCKLKTIMKEKYNEHLTNVVKKHDRELTLCKEEAQKEIRERDIKLRRFQAENQSLKMDFKKLKAELSQLKTKAKVPVQEITHTSSPLNKSRSLEQIGYVFTDENISVIQPVNLTFSTENHINARQQNLIQELDDVEVFNDRNMADLKAGICRLPQQLDRLSVLQYRNSLCPPHLKSSYPLETQSYDPYRYHEDSIRGREKTEAEQVQRQSVKNNRLQGKKLPSHDRLRALFK